MGDQMGDQFHEKCIILSLMEATGLRKLDTWETNI